MNLYRAEEICIRCCKQFKDGVWEETPQLHAGDAFVITDATDHEHDQILNIQDNLEDNLKGYLISLHLKDRKEDDPSQICLTTIPVKSQLIRHQDKYYMVELVVQSTSFGIAVYVNRSKDPEALLKGE